MHMKLVTFCIIIPSISDLRIISIALIAFRNCGGRLDSAAGMVKQGLGF
jgi:hypothetical protein